MEIIKYFKNTHMWSAWLNVFTILPPFCTTIYQSECMQRFDILYNLQFKNLLLLQNYILARKKSTTDFAKELLIPYK